MEPPLHPDLEPIAWLLGTWSGRGHGEYPTIEPFDYLETITFAHVGKPFLAYQQRTRSPEGAPMHAEVGYLRCPGGGARLEWLVSHPTGVAEIAEGTVVGRSIRLVSSSIVCTPAAKSVTAVERDLDAEDGSTLAYAVRMAAVGEPLTHHLAATLHRQDDALTSS
jgi:hypothetical protein